MDRVDRRRRRWLKVVVVVVARWSCCSGQERHGESFAAVGSIPVLRRRAIFAVFQSVFDLSELADLKNI